MIKSRLIQDLLSDLMSSGVTTAITGSPKIISDLVAYTNNCTIRVIESALLADTLLARYKSKNIISVREINQNLNSKDMHVTARYGVTIREEIKSDSDVMELVKIESSGENFVIFSHPTATKHSLVSKLSESLQRCGYAEADKVITDFLKIIIHIKTDIHGFDYIQSISEVITRDEIQDIVAYNQLTDTYERISGLSAELQQTISTNKRFIC